jgi:hypothetical protein
MLSTSELLTCHHDAKRLPASDRRGQKASDGQEARPQPALFRPGLRVTIGLDGGEERTAVARWTRRYGADITVMAEA